MIFYQNQEGSIEVCAQFQIDARDDFFLKIYIIIENDLVCVL